VLIEFPVPLDKPSKVDLKVVGLDKGLEKHLFLRYPQQLVPCAANSTQN
jgi:hypothetical protein